MPIEFLYLGTVFAVAIILFAIVKRPLYECMFFAFIALLTVTGTWANAWTYTVKAIKDSSLYVIIVFVISASLLGKTSVIDDCIAIILGLFGRITGGAGFVAVIGSSYMGSLSGSGPGNVATTGVFTIPAMINSGFPRHLAANVEAHSSTMGNMIPPAGMIATAYGILNTLYPDRYTLSQYWMLLWGIAAWFILQRIVTLYVMCKYYKVKPMRKEDIPNLKEVFRHGWKAVFLPIVVFLPFLLTSKFPEFFDARMGANGGSKAFSSDLLCLLPSFIVVFGILLSDKKTKKTVTLPFMYKEIEKGMLNVVPTAGLVLFAYCVSNVFVSIGMEKAIGEFINGLALPKFALVLVIPLACAILGMLLPGSTQVKIFGGIIISVWAAAGINPFLAAGLLPCICGAMHGVTPPYCTCVYIGMGIAQAELWPTLKNCGIWILLHYALTVVVLLGWIPIPGLNV